MSPLRVLALIPARGGSKGVPQKNLRLLAGQSLVERAFRVAESSGVAKQIVLSTDSEEIAEHARSFGLEVPFLRPAELATDSAGMLGVVQHALEATPGEFDAVLLLQPTSPLRTSEHLRTGVAMLDGNDSVCTVNEVPRVFSPHYVLKEVDGLMMPFMDGPAVQRRQDVPPVYSREGTLYLTRTDVVRSGSLYGERCRGWVLPVEQSLSIDTEADWQEAERRLANR